MRNALLAISAANSRPVVLIGDRGRGKSHIMAVLDAAFRQPKRVEEWAADWAKQIDEPAFRTLAVPPGFAPVSAVMSDHEYVTVWEPIFAALPQGQVFLGRFQASGTSVPARSLIEELFSLQPTALLLDELQTWYGSLAPGSGGPLQLAFNFIQILSEIATDRPELLRLIVSVRNSDTDAYRQIHRNDPVLVDFKGGFCQS